MAVENVPLIAFNRGLVSKLALARVDIKRTALSAEIYSNFMPRVLGSMMLRPGTGFIGATRANLKAYYLDFIFNLNDTALLELTNLNLRIWINDVLLTRVAVGTAVINGDFAANVVGWTDNDEGLAASAWSASFGGSLRLQGFGTSAAIRDQQVVVAGADQGKEHALRIVIERGPVTLLVGNALADDTYVRQTVLDTGTHSLAFTPVGNFWIRFLARGNRIRYVGSCNVEAAGVVALPTPWVEADLPRVRYEASGDITYLACKGTYQQRAIERRATRSWSVVLYAPEDGPFLTENVSTTTITASGTVGECDLTASAPIFRSTHVGALFRLSSVGQFEVTIGALLNDATTSIRVTGVGTLRTISITLSGFFDGVRTFVLESSFDNSTWTPVPGQTWVAAVVTTFLDGLDNQIVYYRLRISVLGGAGGTVMQLSIPTGSITGVVRITSFTSSVLVHGDILSDIGGTTATAIWAEGAWSDFRGYPSAVAFHNGRLTWAGKANLWGSVSDGFYSFDDRVEGDSGPIFRSIGAGPVDNINWALGLQRLILGADMAEQEVATSSLDEPITPTNFTIRPASTNGSHVVAGIKLDTRAIFVSRGGTRVYQLALDPAGGDYVSQEQTGTVPDLFEDNVDTTIDRSIVRIGIQRKPDTRLHCIRADGTAAIMVHDRVEQVTCWVDFETDGTVEDVVVLPGSIEDNVYYTVKRTINGATVRYLERWATELEARGGTITKIADAHIIYQGAPITHVIGLGALEGKQVVVWADGIDVGRDLDTDALIYTVTSGHIDLAVAASTIIVGLPYNGDWKAAKLSYAAQLGTALTQKKKVGGLAMILKDTHARGVYYGPDFDSLDPLPQIEDGAPVDPDFIWSEYDKAAFEFTGDWDSDPRLCIRAIAPRPATILAIIPTVETHEKQ